MIRSRYRIVVEGELDDAIAARFDDVGLAHVDGCTVLSTTPVDQAALNGVLDRLRLVGVELVALERMGAD